MRAISASVRAGAASLALALVSSLASRADAQSQGFALDRYEPASPGDVSFVSDRPWYGGLARVLVRAGLRADYAYNPLVVREGSQGSAVDRVVVAHMALAHAQVGVGIVDRLGIHLSVPVSLLQSGPRDGENTPGALVAASSVAPGDPRIGARVRLFNHTDRDPISLHVGGELFFNIGLLGVNRASNTTDNGFRGRVHVTAAGRGGPVRWSLQLGTHLRPTTTINDLSVSHEGFVNGALQLVAANDRLAIGPEFSLATTFARPFAWRENYAEALVGVHYHIADVVLVGAGGGVGLSQGPGTPAARAVLHVAYAPAERFETPLHDRDRDGVNDPDDLCPDEPQGEHPDPARRGCPLGDRDHDTVLDPEDECIDEPQGEHPDPAHRGCPARDRDGDGVFDPDDQCVDTPQGEHPDPTRRGCPDGDRDSDGVRDSEDQCPSEPMGLNPDPDRRGCPAPDRDHDTVPDRTDACPDQPGAPSSDPRRNGCPGLIRVEGGQLRLLRPVFFATNRDVILPRSYPVLNAVVDALRVMQTIRHVRIEGHTDDVGRDERNLDLSNRRAFSVLRYLTDHQIEGDRLEARGFGETRPVIPIEGLRGRALSQARSQNRRVEFQISAQSP